MNKTIDYLKKILLATIVAFSNMFLSSLVLSFVAYGRKDSEAFPLMMLVSMIIANILIIFCFSLFLKNNDKSTMYELRLLKKFEFKKIVIAILLPLVIVLFSIVFSLFFPAQTGSTNNTTQTLTQYNGPWPYFVAVLYPVIFAPIFEELIYRGVFGSIFKIFDNDNKVNQLIFIITSVLIFGLLHLQTTGTSYSIITSFLFPAFSGVIFSLEYVKTRNLIYPIITHSIYNFIVILLQFS